jgi:hypothetical protein
MVSALIIWDVLWLIIIRPNFLYVRGRYDPLVLRAAEWRYNHYVVYATVVLLLVKVLVLFLLSRTVDFEWYKLVSRHNFTMNFLRFTNPTFVDSLLQSTDFA